MSKIMYFDIKQKIVEILKTISGLTVYDYTGLIKLDMQPTAEVVLKTKSEVTKRLCGGNPSAKPNDVTLKFAILVKCKSIHSITKCDEMLEDITGKIEDKLRQNIDMKGYTLASISDPVDFFEEHLESYFQSSAIINLNCETRA